MADAGYFRGRCALFRGLASTISRPADASTGSVVAGTGEVDLAIAFDLGVATLGGAAIGLERQWSGHASGPAARFGGFRTFTLLGGISGLAGFLATGRLLPIAVVVLAASASLIVAAYVAASRSDIDGTTEVAALIVLVAGALAGSGQVVLSSAVVAATAVLLLEKSKLHALATRLDDTALRASARFAAMACVVLPLLPVGPYGPLDAVRPRELWALVLFFSGLSFLGWIARRAVSSRYGIVMSGLIGGLISSTSVTMSFARESRLPDAPRLALGLGAVAACTVMLVRVAVASAVLNPPLTSRLPRYLVPAFGIGLAALLAVGRKSPALPRPQAAGDSPLQLRAALQMTGWFQLALFVILTVQARWSAQALLATSMFVGLTDVDALTLSLARSAAAAEALPTAGEALAAGVLANTLLKLAVAVAVGRGAFRAVTALTLGAMAAAMAGAILIR